MRNRWLAGVGLTVILVVAVLIGASMVWPVTVPRLAILPGPEQTQRPVDCNTATRYWERDGLFWSSEEFQTLAGCGGIDGASP